MIVSVTAEPETDNVPVGREVNPGTEGIEYEYVPFGSVNSIVFEVEDTLEPSRITDHWVPLGRPFSLKLTEYSFGGLRAIKVAFPLLYTF